MLPAKLTASLAPILKFVATRNENVEAQVVAMSLEQSDGQDDIHLKVRPITNGMAYRLEFEDGVIQALGQLILQQSL